MISMDEVQREGTKMLDLKKMTYEQSNDSMSDELSLTTKSYSFFENGQK